ncbi:DUF4276 family protein [Pseudomonas sp. W03]|uniref:DUF4276 family protein n=1 Tax=Pseudomonas sp. W03 TaxID=3090666 RepID=UPI003A4E00D6
MIEKIIFLIEEYSMEVTLTELLPKVITDIDFEIIRFQCKDDLLKQLQGRLRAYASWIPDNWRIVVLVDRDDDNCIRLKQQLENISAQAGLVSKTAAAPNAPFKIVNRIAIEELEAWFFGDWQAVKAAYPKVSVDIPKRAGFRDPDAIKGGTWEAMERVLKGVGYFKTGLRKAEFAREVSAKMDPQLNTSKSFQVFLEALV